MASVGSSSGSFEYESTIVLIFERSALVWPFEANHSGWMRLPNRRRWRWAADAIRAQTTGGLSRLPNA
jgi:hypothetical protein